MFSHVRELVEIAVARLFFHIFEMNTSLVNSDRSTGFHSGCSDTPSGDALRKVVYGRFGASSAFYHLSSYMHQSVEECSSGDDDALGIEFGSPDGFYADGFSVSYEQFVSLVLPDVEVVGVVEDGSPFPDKLSSVALGTGAPYGRTLSDVEHSELDGGFIRYDTHLSAQSIDFAHNLSLGNTSDGGVATHLSNLVHIHRYQTGFGTHVCRGCSSLASGMSSTDNEHVIIEFHTSFNLYFF